MHSRINLKGKQQTNMNSAFGRSIQGIALAVVTLVLLALVIGPRLGASAAVQSTVVFRGPDGRTSQFKVEQGTSDYKVTVERQGEATAGTLRCKSESPDTLEATCDPTGSITIKAKAEGVFTVSTTIDRDGLPSINNSFEVQVYRIDFTNARVVLEDGGKKTVLNRSSNEVSLIQGERRALTVEVFAPKESDFQKRISVKVEDVGVVKDEKSGGKLLISAQPVTDRRGTLVTVNYALPSGTGVQEVLNFKAEVLEAVETLLTDSNQEFNLYEFGSRNIKVSAKGVQKSNFTFSEISDKFSAVANKPDLLGIRNTSDGIQVTAKPLPTASLREDAEVTLSVERGSKGEKKTLTLKVIILGRPGSIVFEPPELIIHPQGRGTTRAFVRSRTNAEMTDKVIVWNIEDTNYEKWVTYSYSGNSLTVAWRDTEPEQPSNEKRPSVIKFNAVARGAADPQGTEEGLISGGVFVRLLEVNKFGMLKVQLNMMDDLSASDLYGRQASDEYHVLLVRMFNDLKDEETNQYVGSSILAFSGSIEIAVAVEKKIDPKSKSQPTGACFEKEVNENPKRWFPARAGDMSCAMQLINQESPNPRFISRIPINRNLQLKNDITCQGAITYRPLTFEMVVNTADRRSERSFRSRAFTLGNFIGAGASFISGVAVPGQSSDLPVALEKYTNLFLPGMQKLFPSKSEFHRQNLVSQVMKPIEEIPFGSDITRVLFIPKKEISSLIPGHLARISQVCPYYFKAQVAIIRKGERGDVEINN